MSTNRDKKMSVSDLETIVYCHKILRQNSTEIAERVGLSSSSVSAVIRVYTNATTGNWDGVLKVVKSGFFSLPVLTDWLKTYGEEVPQNIVDAFETRKQRYSQPKKPTQEKPEPEEKIALSDSQQDLSFYLTELIKVEKERNELLTQLMDTVFPHWAKEIQDTINTNSDVILKEVSRCADYMDKVRFNTSKKVYRG